MRQVTATNGSSRSNSADGVAAAEFLPVGENLSRVSRQMFCRWVGRAGFLLATCTVTLAAHAALALAQSSGLIPGDYGQHMHGLLAPLSLAGLIAGLAAFVLYGSHLAGLDAHSLPPLASTLRERLGWQTVALTSVAACLLLFGMESAEQLAAHHFDGFLSAFSGVPAFGLGLIALFSLAANAVMRAVCTWLVEAHTRIVLAIAFLLRRCTTPVACAAHLRQPCLATLRCASVSSRVYGKRAPPNPR
jgi:hypothetical protein